MLTINYPAQKYFHALINYVPNWFTGKYSFYYVLLDDLKATSVLCQFIQYNLVIKNPAILWESLFWKDTTVTLKKILIVTQYNAN